MKETYRHYILIALAVLLFLNFQTGCSFDQVAGPSDAQLQAQSELNASIQTRLEAAKKQYAEMVDGSEEKASFLIELDKLRASAQEAQLALDQLKADRQAAEEKAKSAFQLADLLVPGSVSSTLLFFIYGLIQKLRNKKNLTALNATMIAIEDFKKIGGEDAAKTLVESLIVQHDRAGVRTAVRKSLAEIKAPDTAL